MKLVKDIQAHIRGVVERGCAKMMLVPLIDLDKTTLFLLLFHRDFDALQEGVAMTVIKKVHSYRIDVLNRKM